MTTLVAQTVHVGVTPVQLFQYTTALIAMDVTTPALGPQSRVWIGSDSSVAPGKGFALPPGAKMTLDCSSVHARDGAVWASAEHGIVPLAMTPYGP